ncbi:MAG: PAS domain-containing protein [Pseudomonadota bacterium]
MNAVIVKDMIRSLPGDEFLRRMGDQVLTDLFAYWDAKRRGRRLPQPGDIDPARVDAVSAISGLVIVTKQGQKYCYRRLGNPRAREIPRDIAENALSASVSADYVRSLSGLYTALTGVMRPIFSEGEGLGKFGARYPVKRLLLPVSSDGTGLDMICYAALPQETRWSDTGPMKKIDDLMAINGVIYALAQPDPDRGGGEPLD